MEQDGQDLQDGQKTKLEHKKLTEAILGSSFQVLNELGAGFLEKVYENALAVALREAGLHVEQ